MKILLYEKEKKTCGVAQQPVKVKELVEQLKSTGVLNIVKSINCFRKKKTSVILVSISVDLFKVSFNKDVLIDKIKHKYLFYRSNLTVNGYFWISNLVSILYDSRDIVQCKYQN